MQCSYLVFSDNVDEHIGHLHQVFSRPYEVGLKLHPQKCILGCPEVPYLDYVISAEGILPNPDKVLAVKECSTLLTSELYESFLVWQIIIGGLCLILPRKLGHYTC